MTTVIEVRDIEILGIVTFGSKESLAVGPTGNGIASIELTSTVGLVKTYTITYTNGTTTTFEVSDGVIGEDGNGIESIELVETAGLVKTYRITFTDATTFEYDVSDGVIGADGVGIESIVLTSTVGLIKTYTITFTDATTTTFDVSDGEDGSTPVITFVGTVIYVDGVAGPDLKGDPGDPGPNEVSTSTLTDITGLLAGDGTNVKQAVGAIDYMPAYNLNDFTEWASGDFVVGDKRYAKIEGPDDFFETQYFICIEDHTGTTGPRDGESDKWIMVCNFIEDERIQQVDGIVLSDGEGGVTAAVPAIDFMPAYDLNDFTEWATGQNYVVGDKKLYVVSVHTDKYIDCYFICIEDHASTTGPTEDDESKWILVSQDVYDVRLYSVTGIVTADGTGGVSAATQSDIEAILTGEVTSHTHPITDEIEFSLINAWRY
jgi:hypothetical protein